LCLAYCVTASVTVVVTVLAPAVPVIVSVDIPAGVPVYLYVGLELPHPVSDPVAYTPITSNRISDPILRRLGHITSNNPASATPPNARVIPGV
jgi:hypothetical protein